jgi:aspartate ammonia-lyase
VIKESIKTGKSIREIVVGRGLMTDEEVSGALDVLAMTKGGIVK